ncbi:MAG: sensor histidine kinase [Rhodocyclaceae bacterium]
MPESFLPLALPWILVALLVTLLVTISARRRKRMKRILAQSSTRRGLALTETQCRMLLELASDWVWLTDAEHRFSELDERFGAATGLKPRRVLGRCPWDVDWEAVGERGWERYRAAIARGEAAGVTVRYSERNGAYRYLELHAKPMFVSDVCTGYLGMAHDVTMRVSTEKALLESRALYEDVVNSVREVVFRAGADMRFTLLNRAWESITNHSLAESLGHSLIDFLHPDDRESAERSMGVLLRGDMREFHGQFRLLKRNGEICWIELTARLIPGEGLSVQPPSLVGTIDDISTRKIAEMTLRNINQELEARVRMRTAELEASNRELEAFSYSVSHDLRAPLRSIDGFARILEEDLGERLDAASRDHLERIRAAASRMSYLSDKLIELARFTRHSLRRESVDLSEMAEQILDDLRTEQPERKVEIELTSDLVAIADKALVHVVLDNLLRNAWKFTSRRDVARISFSASLTDGERVFCVADNGAGFDMAFAANLFRPFYRLHDESEFTGSGIGLANVQRIIQRHGGRIWAESSPEQGAHFYFTLSAPHGPVAPDPQPA